MSIKVPLWLAVAIVLAGGNNNTEAGYAKVEHRVAPEVLLVSSPAPATKPKRPRGRPKSITDMKTYKAERQREYRAKWKGRE